MARPKIYTDDTVVAVNAASARSKLQQGSDRRAIVNLLVENGGRMTLGQIDKHFDFDIRNRVMALIKAGWLEVVQ